jgi:hypothetical protein
VSTNPKVKIQKSAKPEKIQTENQHVPNSNVKIPKMRNQSSPKPFFG